MSIEESVRKYQELTGETVEVKPGYAVKTIGDEFMVWKLGLRDGVPFFWIDQTYGHMKNFVDFIREVCRTAEIEILATATQRPKPFIRKWKMVLVSEYDYENRHYFILKTHISNLKG